MKRHAQWVVVGVLVLLGTGCGRLQAVWDVEEISATLHKDMIDYYENMAQAYYLLGYGYYRLYREAEKRDLPEAEQYRNMAALYKRHYEDLKQSMTMLRGRMEPAGATLEPAPTVSETAPGPAEPETLAPIPDTSDFESDTDAGTPPTEEPSPTPATWTVEEERPSLLERLQFWKRR